MSRVRFRRRLTSTAEPDRTNGRAPSHARPTDQRSIPAPQVGSHPLAHSEEPSPAPARRQSFRVNVFALVGAQGTTWVLAALGLLVLSRYLGAADIGMYFTAEAFKAVGVIVAGLGMENLLTRRIARDRTGSSGSVGTALWLAIACGSVAAVAALGVAVLAGYSSDLLLLIAIASVAIPFWAVLGPLYGVAQGLERMRWQAGSLVAGRALATVGWGVAIVFDLGVVGVVVAGTVAMGLNAFGTLIFVARHVAQWSWRFSPRIARGLVIEGLPFWSLAVVLVLYRSIDVIMLSRLATPEDAGVYGTPLTLFGSMLIVSTVAGTVTFPQLSAGFRTSPDGWSLLGWQALRIVISLTVPIVIVTVGFGAEFLVLVIGDDFTASRAVLIALSVMLVPVSANIMLGRMLIACDRERRWTLITAFGLGLKFVLNFALIWGFDRWVGNAALGAAISFGASETVMMIGGLSALPPNTLRRRFSPFYLRLGLAAGASAEAMVIAFIAAPGLLGLPAVLGLVTYGVLALMLGIHDRQQLEQGLAWVRGRAGGGSAPPPASPAAPTTAVPAAGPPSPSRRPAAVEELAQTK